ncbi:MAG: hypothetical protein ACFFAO_18590, partial [Candidatus Hermodarchaeota archaeon]
LLISWIIPFMWVIKDSKIKYLDNNHNIKNLYENVNKSLLNRIIRVAGIFFAISFIVEYNSTLDIPIIENIIFTIFTLIFFMLFMGITSMAVGINYIGISHQKVVNNVRKNLEENNINMAETSKKLTDKKILSKYRKSMNLQKPKEITINLKLIVTIPLVIFMVFYISSFFIGYTKLIYDILFLLLISINLIVDIFAYIHIKKRKVIG